MNIILEGLKIPSTCIGVRVPILNEAVAKNRKLCHFIMELIRDCQILKKGSVFATSAVLETADELILAQNENRPPNLRKVMHHTADSVTLMCRTQK